MTSVLLLADWSCSRHLPPDIICHNRNLTENLKSPTLTGEDVWELSGPTGGVAQFPYSPRQKRCIIVVAVAKLLLLLYCCCYSWVTLRGYDNLYFTAKSMKNCDV